MKHLRNHILILVGLLMASGASAEEILYRMRLDGPIGPTTAEFFERGIDRARTDEAICLIVEMDTPGGLDSAMRQMVKPMLNDRIPVVIYVSPSGSRAASAGAFLTVAAHVAAMAPGTNIGAAHPVQIGGGIADTTMAAKVANDAAAYIRSIAEKRGRNITWAEKAVRESISLTESEALSHNLIDLVAPTFPALLDSLHGRQVVLRTETRTLQTRNARTVAITMGFRERLLSQISNPNIAYILMILGIYGLIFELSNPGSVLPGVVGGICLILAFYAFQTLPVNYAGVLLILLGIVLLVLEIKITSYGLLTLSGILALALGSTMLIEAPGHLFRISWFVIGPALLVTALFFTFAVGMGIRAQQSPPYNSTMAGKAGVARTEISESGTVFVDGEYWQARADQKIETGQNIQVVEENSGILKVKPT